MANRERRLMAGFASSIGVGLLLLLCWGWIDTITDGGIERLAGQSPGVWSRGTGSYTSLTWFLLTVLYVSCFAAGFAALSRTGQRGVLVPWAAAAVILLAGSGLSLTPDREPVLLVEQLGGWLGFAAAWWTAGAAVGWDGSLPGGARRLRVAVIATLGILAVLMWAAVGGFIFWLVR